MKKKTGSILWKTTLIATCMGIVGVVATIREQNQKKEEKAKAELAAKEEAERIAFRSEPLTWDEFVSTNGVKIVAQYPSNPNCPINTAIQQWMSEMLGGTYEGAMDNGKNMLEYYGRNKAQAAREAVISNGEGLAALENFASYHQLKIQSETERQVTYTYQHYHYNGGPHPSDIQRGYTFRKSDGKQLCWDMFRPESIDTLRTMVRGEIRRRYFRDISEEDFLASIFTENAAICFPLPETCPFFTDKGVKFIYQQYEIGPYAIGMPSCVIPFERLRPYFSEEAHDLIW